MTSTTATTTPIGSYAVTVTADDAFAAVKAKATWSRWSASTFGSLSCTSVHIFLARRPTVADDGGQVGDPSSSAQAIDKNAFCLSG